MKNKAYKVGDRLLIIIKSERQKQQEKYIRNTFLPPKNLSRAEINEATAVIAARTEEIYRKQRRNINA